MGSILTLTFFFLSEGLTHSISYRTNLTFKFSYKRDQTFSISY